MKLADFEVLVTFDQNLPYQQNTALPVAVVVLVASNNRVETAMKFVPRLLSTLVSLTAGQIFKLELE